MGVGGSEIDLNMQDPFNCLAKILRVKPEALLELEEKMSQTLLRQGSRLARAFGEARVGGRGGVIEKIARENDLLVKKTLAELGLSKESKADEVRKALQERLIDLDKSLPSDWQGLADKALSLVSGPSTGSGQPQTVGFFIRKEKAIELLEKYPPQNIPVDKDDIESVFAALRFTQTNEWMHSFFDEAYDDLKPEDFEERPMQLKVLEEKWLKVADKFLEKKYHNVSHLKELGIIFVIPLKLDTPGEALRVFTLLLHYLNEVPFYSKLLRKFSQESDFAEKLKSLLRGDVLTQPKGDWLIIQRYLAKDDENDPRLTMPHINPEAEHWFKAQESLAKLGPDFAFWKELDFAGSYFPSSVASAKEDRDELVSFDLIDQVMTLVKKGEAKYLYHQQEALWNKIFIEYFGREKMNELIEENIVKGYIEL